MLARTKDLMADIVPLVALSRRETAKQGSS